MDKVIIEFRFDGEDAQDKREELDLFLKAREMSWALNSIREKLRAHEKYDAPALTQDDFYSILCEYGINGLDI